MTIGIPFGRAAGHSVLFASLLVAAAMATTNAFAGECPTGKMQANVRPQVNTPASGVTDTHLGLDRSRQRAGDAQGPRIALPQANDCAWRRGAVAQPRRSSCADLRGPG